MRIASEAAAEYVGTRSGSRVESGLEIVLFCRGLSGLSDVVQRGIVENHSDAAGGGEIETSLSDAGIVEIVGEHLNLNGVVIQCLVECFVNLASSCVPEPDVHVSVSKIVAVLCPRLLRHVEKPVARGFELCLGAVVAGVGLGFQKCSGKTYLEAAFREIADGDRNGDGSANVEREELLIGIEERGVAW